MQDTTTQSWTEVLEEELLKLKSAPPVVVAHPVGSFRDSGLQRAVYNLLATASYGAWPSAGGLADARYLDSNRAGQHF
jgi:hypothetical protein